MIAYTKSFGGLPILRCHRGFLRGREIFIVKPSEMLLLVVLAQDQRLYLRNTVIKKEEAELSSQDNGLTNRSDEKILTSS